jgi:hypothetical protein
MFSRRLFLGLMLFAIPASADLLQIAISGTFGDNVPTSTLSAPDTSWTITFDIPALQAADTLGSFGGVGVTNFEYEFNNNLVTTGHADPEFEGVADGAEFQEYLNDGTTPVLFVLGLSTQLYSESATNSEILTGSFAVLAGTDFTYVSVVTDAYYTLNAGPIVITDLSAVPEPGAVILLGTVVLAVVFASRLRRRRRSAALCG